MNVAPVSDGLRVWKASLLTRGVELHFVRRTAKTNFTDLATFTAV